MEEKFTIILEKAVTIFHTYGIRGVSMDDVCRELSISKKTLYQFVANKEELISRIVEMEIKRHIDHVKEFSKQNLNSIDALFEISKIISINIRKINPSFNYDLNKYYPEIFKMQLDHKREMIFKTLKGNIIQGIKDGFYREDLDIDLIVKLYIQKLELIRDPDNWTNDKDSCSRIFKVMFENHIRGISNKKGIKYLEQKMKSLNFKI